MPGTFHSLGRERAGGASGIRKTGSMGWDSAALARKDFADTIEGLTPDQVKGTTLCDLWTPHLVAAHLVTFVDVPLPKFMFNVAKHRGNFDPAADEMAQKIGKRTTEDLVATLRAKAGKKSALPIFPEGLTLVDTVAHHQDVRRGLGIDVAPRAEHVKLSLEFLTTQKQAKALLETKGLLDGLRFEATDLDWSSGDGELVSGPGESILMAILRRDTTDELTGDGVATLKARIAAAKSES